ncbi:MAG: carbohydrate ABC transporter permease [Nitrospinota bacterium]|nr:MAG: carbohydrate ABC transporter permease [Nitrospinota bacterium]
MTERTYELWLKVAVLHLVAFLMLVPFAWLVSTALKAPGEVFSETIQWIPQKLRFANFREIMDAAPFMTYLYNTIIVVTSILVLQLLLIIPAAYALARLEFPGSDYAIVLFIIQIMLPIETILLPNYFLIKAFGLLNTKTALVLPFVASGFGTFLFRQTFKQIPKELEDAARIDGAGHFRFIWSVLLPLSRPTLVTFSMLSIATHWDDFYWPLIVTETDNVRTLAIGLGLFVKQESGSEWNLLMAATLFVCAPVILLFLIGQRAFIKNFLTSGIKG